MAECYTLMIRCFNLSEKYRVPVIFLMDEIVGHMREGVDSPAIDEPKIVNRALPPDSDEAWLPYHADSFTEAPRIPPFGTGRNYHITGLIHDERGYPTSGANNAAALITRLTQKIDGNLDDIVTFQQSLPQAN